MKAIIKSIYSPDTPVSVEDWAPRSLNSLYVLIELEVGPDCEDGADIFSVVVTSCEALVQRKPDSCILAGRGHIIVSKWDFLQIKEHLQAIVRACAGVDWVDTALKLNRHFLWEYEDMVVEHS